MGPATATSMVNEWLIAAIAGTVAVTVTGCAGVGARSAATAACELNAATPSASDILIRNLEVTRHGRFSSSRAWALAGRA